MTPDDYAVSDSVRLQKGLQRFREAINRETRRERRKSLFIATGLLLSSLTMAVYVAIEILPTNDSMNIWSFNNTPLHQVFLELEQAYEMKLSVANTQLLVCPVTGKFYASSPRQVVPLIARSLKLEISSSGADQYQLSGQRCMQQE